MVKRKEWMGIDTHKELLKLLTPIVVRNITSKNEMKKKKKRNISATTIILCSPVLLITLVDVTVGLALCFRFLPDGHMTPYILSEWLMSLAHRDLEGPGRCPSK